MSRPEDVPQGVWDAAHEEVEAMPERPPFKVEVQQAIARAIFAERERCAKVLADNHTIISGEPADPMMPQLIDAIRAGATYV